MDYKLYIYFCKNTFFNFFVNVYFQHLSPSNAEFLQVQKNTHLQNYYKNIKKQCKLNVKRTKNCKHIFVKMCFYIFQ